LASTVICRVQRSHAAKLMASPRNTAGSGIYRTASPPSAYICEGNLGSCLCRWWTGGCLSFERHRTGLQRRMYRCTNTARSANEMKYYTWQSAGHEVKAQPDEATNYYG
jgi:hypothetical protein